LKIGKYEYHDIAYPCFVYITSQTTLKKENGEAISVDELTEELVPRVIIVDTKNMSKRKKANRLKQRK
jgi:hypothetical protein